MNNPSNCFICIEGVSKSYVEGGISRYILRNAQASFLFGEFIAILGKSGSGKSTLLTLISGIDLVDEGSIWIDQQQLMVRVNYSAHYSDVKNWFIFQLFNLIPTLTSLENVSSPRIKRNESSKRRTRYV
jgi:ABC-type lipoprotein export system ATPase subunit